MYLLTYLVNCLPQNFLSQWSSCYKTSFRANAVKTDRDKQLADNRKNFVATDGKIWKAKTYAISRWINIYRHLAVWLPYLRHRSEEISFSTECVCLRPLWFLPRDAYV